MIGCTSSPVSGAAINSPAISSTLAPSVSKMRLALAFYSPNANWMPRNPKHMFQICQNDRVGFAFAGIALISLHVEFGAGLFARRLAR